MKERKRILLLILIMAVVALSAAGISISILYRAALNEQRTLLVEAAQNQARLIEAVYRFSAIHNRDYPGGPLSATISQIAEAHRHYKGFGETGEFTLATRKGNDIIFLLAHRHYDLGNPKPVPFDSELAEPMRRALKGLAGTVSALDYRGVTVLGAYEPVPKLNLGIVAKIDLEEVRAPFVRAGLLAVLFACLVVLAGAIFFKPVSDPIIQQLSQTNQRLQIEIAERRQMEEKLRKSRDELEFRVSERTAELEARNKELRDFTYIASHDLQEPLRKVQMFGDILTDKCGTLLDEASRDYLQRMVKATARMQTLIQSLLSYSRLTTATRASTETNLMRSVKTALDNLEFAIEDKNARVELGELPTVLADRVQMVQLFQNLIENSLKFSREEEPPHVKIYGRVKVESGVCEVCVEDNGIGFDEQYVDKIFLPFQRLHGKSSGYDGTGIGLAICRKIAAQHGGEITARGAPGKGATMTVTLPIPQSDHSKGYDGRQGKVR